MWLGSVADVTHQLSSGQLTKERLIEFLKSKAKVSTWPALRAGKLLTPFLLETGPLAAQVGSTSSYTQHKKEAFLQ